MTLENKRLAERPGPVPWPPILIAGTAVAAVALGYAFPIAWPGIDDWPAQLIGYGAGVMGILLFLWSGYTLHSHKTTVMPHKGVDTLVTTGPYLVLRNPIYVGDVLIFLGAAELTKNVWFVLLLPVFVGLITWLQILPEERHLEAKFGDRYRAYKAKTRRWI